MTIETIMWVVIAVASFLSAVLVIWNFSNRVKGSLDKTIVETVEKLLDKYDKTIDKKIENATGGTQQELQFEIRDLNNKIERYFKSQEKKNERDYDSIKLLKESLIEAYKQDIRNVYYKLRRTGEITDADKSYVDKLYPKYVALGGNSDIQAKYEEMCRVYETITQENFRKARERYLDRCERDLKDNENEKKDQKDKQKDIQKNKGKGE